MAEPTNEPLATVAETETEQLPRTKEKLDELSQAASIHYATKNFPAAAENYANAVEIQAELNGEMAPENAELLFYYGRALYKVAVAKSDVLGNKVAQEEKKNKKPKAKKATKTDDSGEGSSARAPIFELARVLYEKQLESLESGASDKGKGKAELSPRARTLKERIADCHGFLVEISLENERFHDAISDARAALTLQQELYPFEHENVTEAHYSLSLALEFASVSKVRQDQTGQSASAPEETDADAKQGKEDEDGVNWDLRNEAAEQTDLAIQSLEARLKKEEAALASDALTPEQKKEKQAIIKDKKGMLEDLKTRVADLKADPTKQAFDSIDPSVFQGILGGMLGADAVTQAAKIAEAKKNANDVSGMVKKKAKAPVVEEAKDVGGSKRKLEVDDDAADKRAKTEEPI
ncbi:SHNi-TPR domain containing protein [Pyrenophora tritici-repentis]|nr:SHNi-TPR domain-containing protein [Pyrenophora tritici-repentis]KAI0618311.1 SHNi-TPR domain-containing protein [Pyrenophora tritici-repentis]KAI1525938.1 SHNi-TPR domain containing protein [Pyrenophora tritici-repentis]KAI1526466.1 SHNi-TPR domain containing protein [Pyrenophora tritici-repentis]KAI1533523.1 SHNi-TPR domain containing protein [Pyrenophora tritici-repentis]